MLSDVLAVLVEEEDLVEELRRCACGRGARCVCVCVCVCV